MDPSRLCRVIAVLAIFATVLSHTEWASVPDPVVYVCKGKTLHLPWILKTDLEDVETVRWSFHGIFSSELISTYTLRQFFAGKKYTNRVVQQQNSGIIIRDVTPNDEGNYSVEVIVRNGNSSLVSYFHTVMVQVGDGLMVEKGQVEVTQDPFALWDVTSASWLIRLVCGRFLFKGKLPMRVEWVTPTGETRESSGYEGGNFYLSLPRPVIPEGNYTCRIPRRFYPEVCTDGKGRAKPHSGDPPSTEASIFIDEIRARLTLSEAEQGRLGEDNDRLQDQLTNLTMEYQTDNQHRITEDSRLQDQLTNITHECKSDIQLLATEDSRLRDQLAKLTTKCQTDNQLRITEDSRLQDQLTNLTKECKRENQHLLSENSLLKQQIEGMKQDVSRIVSEMEDLRNISSRLEALEFCPSTNSPYKVLDDAKRDVNYNQSTSPYLCDKTLTAGWYRLYLNGQDAVLPTTCPPIQHCRTHASTWLDLQGEALPLVGRDLEARACSHWDNNCCDRNVPITVRNCGAFYIYFLRPLTRCSYAYCFQKAN